MQLRDRSDRRRLLSRRLRHLTISLSVLKAIFPGGPSRSISIPDFIEARMMDMVVTTGLLELQVVQSSSQIITTNICNTQFLQAGCPSCRPTNSVKALEGWPLILLSDNNGSGLKTRNFRPICRSWKRYKIGPYCEMFFQILSVPITLKLE